MTRAGEYVWPSVRRARLALVVLVTVAMALVGAGPAAAHTGLVASSPEADAVLVQAPREVVLTFSEPVDPLFAQVQLVVYGSPGAYLEVTRGSDDRTVAATVPANADGGRWRIDYRVTSVDGHPVEGSVGFQVGNEPTADPSSAAEATTDPAPPQASSTIDIRKFSVAVGAVLLLLLGTSLLLQVRRRRESDADT